MKKASTITYLLLPVIPFVYLAAIYHRLPDMVPTHFNIKGEPDDWSKKGFLWFMPASLPLLLMALFWILPKIDPKQRLKNMEKYNTICMALVVIFTALSCIILHISQQQNTGNASTYIMVCVGFVFIAFGNYFPVIKPNYFIGIRTPWTLENPSVWKKTHAWAARLWVAGGILVVVIALFPKTETASVISFSIIMLIALLPVVYSFIIWKKNKNHLQNQ